ncbi:MAG: SDR family NAD(P)-dependent oxidoreductase, partial [Burkholderiales bacterium]
MDLGLKDTVAVVTGGTQGIGRATALRLAAEGAKVVVCARGRERLDAVVAEIRAAGGAAHAVAADVARAEDCVRIVEEAQRTFGGVDVLVNNAGTARTGAFESVTDEAWQADLDLK